jgi:hypothetical protein
LRLVIDFFSIVFWQKNLSRNVSLEILADLFCLKHGIVYSSSDLALKSRIQSRFKSLDVFIFFKTTGYGMHDMCLSAKEPLFHTNYLS